jgi:hypothetical protein
MTTYRWCGSCGEETVFEPPPCVDGHGPDCPELLCVDCGLAVVIGRVDDVVVVVAEPSAA